MTMTSCKYSLGIWFLVLLFTNFHGVRSDGIGKWTFELNNEYGYATISKSMFNNSQIFVTVTCDASLDTNVSIQWTLAQYECWQDFAFIPDVVSQGPPMLQTNYTLTGPVTQHRCSDHFILGDISPSTIAPDRNSNAPVESEVKKNVKEALNPSKLNHPTPIYTVRRDGLYSLMLRIESSSTFKTTVAIELQSEYGYLSAGMWPLLPFYGAMCLIYVMFGVAWLVVSFCQWRDLLRIQFWIGGVILLGMLEKAVFYAQYQSINSRGTFLTGAVLFAELISCAKRTLARMLVIIVSLGFGIVKPRLGAMLHRVVSTGILYFVLAAVECYKRVTSSAKTSDLFIASLPLALLDSAFCWWIFSNLVQTMRTLRLRRNLVKLSLYRHFSNALYFSVIASCCFMVYSIRFHRMTECLTHWKELWIDEAYWHILFSLILLVIMILWRPTNNNQRYAFTPLLDNPEDEDDEEEQFVSDAFGLKMRGNNSTSPKPKSSTTEEEDLKWVEDNIPAYLSDTALPILDSDEEATNTRFEVSKMQ